MMECPSEGLIRSLSIIHFQLSIRLRKLQFTAGELLKAALKNRKKILDKTAKIDIITFELHTSLIKSGGGNGPMKPGNLLIQGAKSGGNER